MDASLQTLIDRWRILSVRERVRAAVAVGLTGGGALAGYLFGMRHLWLLTLAYARSHPNLVTGPPWLNDPLPRIWLYLVVGAAVGALAAFLLDRLIRRGGLGKSAHASR